MSRWRGFVVIEKRPGKSASVGAWCLEFASFLPRPALDHDFRLGEKLDGIASLSVKNAEETFLPAAEREIRHRRGNTDVNADVARRGLVAEFARGRAARGKKRCLISVRAATEKFHGFVHGIGMNQAEHRSKNLRVRQLAGG